MEIGEILAKKDARIAELENALKRALWTINHDPLTGLLSREGLESAWSEVGKRGRTLALIDLDNFKTINDTYGHAAGNAVLVEIAVRLGMMSQQATRLHGDEFVVLSSLSEYALRTAIGNLMEYPIKIVDGCNVAVAGSVGITTIEYGGSLVDSLAEADRDMYHNKMRRRQERRRWRERD